MTENETDRRPTIRDVAREAGVSHQTVARYLRADSTVNAAMAERIEGAVTALGYRPNLVARAMRNRRTGRLALLLPTGTAISSLEVLAGARTAAHDAGFALELVTLDSGGPVRPGRVLEIADSGLFEGVVSLTPLPPDVADASRTPIVITPLYDRDMRGMGVLAWAGPVTDVVEGLAAAGHRTFLHLAGDYAHETAKSRRDAFLATVERLGLDCAGVVPCDWSAGRARAAVLGLAEDAAVTAIVAANDVLAAGALGGAVYRGWSVPGRLSISGWDANPLGAAITPALTTVEVDYARIGRRAVLQLLAVLADGPPPMDDEPVARVIWRDSTGPVDEAP